MHEPLIDEFQRQPEEHPWWWPAGSGDELTDWGLEREQLLSRGLAPNEIHDIHDSLRLGSKKNRVPENSSCFKGFLGSVGEPAGPVVWVITIRPSLSAFRQARTAWLPRLLRELGLLERTRVTDIVKFRGPAPANRAWSAADATMKRLSLEVLQAEFEHYPPSSVILSGGGTQAAFRSLLKDRVRSVPDSDSTRMLDRLYGLAIPTYFYSAAGMTFDRVRANWKDALESGASMPIPQWLQRYRTQSGQP